MAGHWQIVVPEAGTNLITNSSFETNTTGWALDGTNTIAQSGAVGKFGAYSLLCTYQDDLDLARYAITLTAAAHTFSVWVYLGSTWDGGAVQLAFEDFAGGAVTTATTTTTTLGEWVRLQATYTPVGGDLVGSLVVECASAPTAGRFIYIDAAMCQALSYATTYIDGDQAGCSWSSAAHASTSTRSASSRAGGRVRDLKDDYGFLISQVTDVGMSPITQQLDEYASIPGGEVSGYKIHPRVFVLQGTFYSLSSWENLHSQIQGLIGVMRPDAVPGNQPFLLRYTAASVTKEIACHYEGGMDGRFNAGSGWRTDVAVRLLAADPTWYSEGQSAQALATSASLSAYGIVGRDKDTGTWSALGLTNAPDAGDSVRAILHASDGSVYIGGDFVDLNDTGTGIDRIAKYTPSTGAWSLVGAGSDFANGEVRCLAEDAAGNIWVGGTTTAIAGDGTIDYVTYWDGAAWVSLSDPANGAGSFAGVYGMRELSGIMYIVGDFTTIGGVANASYIAQWDTGTSNWLASRTPAAGAAAITDVQDITALSTGKATVGGDFLNIDDYAAADYAATDFGAAYGWRDVNNSTGFVVPDGAVRTVYYDPVSSRAFYGGEFQQFGTTSSEYIFKNYGIFGDNLNGGMNGIVWDITGDTSGNIYAVGAFTTAGGITVDRMAKWTGSAWSALDFSPGQTIQVIEIGAYDPVDSSKYDIYAGFSGSIVLTDGLSASTTVTNGGSTAAFPQIVIKRSGGTTATIKYVKNNTTGKELNFDYSLADGETLTIDLAPSQKSVTSSSNGNQLGALQAGSDFGEWSLLPGANTIVVLIEETGTPTLICNAIWQDPYWSVS